jgi:thioredoxin reductase (NADPH)
MIPLQEQERLRQHFAERLTGGVKIEHFTQRPMSIVIAGREECRFCNEARQTLEELRGLSPKIGLRIHELRESAKLAATMKVERAPTTILRGQLNRPIRFEGFPGAGLFPVFIDALVNASRGSTELDTAVKRRLQRVSTAVGVRLFVAPGSPFCPPMLQMLYNFALENHRIKVTAIEIEEFPRLAEVMRVPSVPYTIVGEQLRFGGAVNDATLIELIARGSEGRGLSVGESLRGSELGPSTPLSAPSAEPRSSPSGLIIPRR